MKITVDTNLAKRMFEDYDRDYFSWDGLDKLIEFYDESDPEMELDVIGICVDCTEYGGHGASCDFSDLVEEHGDITVDEFEEMTDDEQEEYIDELVEALEIETTVLKIPNGNYIVFNF